MDGWSRAPVCEDCWMQVRASAPANACVRCGIAVFNPAALGPDGCCEPCRLKPPSYDRSLSFSSYDGELRRLIHLFKYDGMRPLAKRLGDRVAELRPRFGEIDLALAAPLHWQRRRERGFNQAALLARRAADAWGCRFHPRALRRVRATPSQAGLSRAERLANVRGAFRVRDRAAVEGRRIALIDDVMTTGATLDACARALKRAGAKTVIAVTLARALPDGRRIG